LHYNGRIKASACLGKRDRLVFGKLPLGEYMENLIITPLMLIIVSSVALLLGLLVGVLFAGLFFQDRGDKAPNKHLKEAAHLWIDRRDGRLVFQIGDQLYKSGTEFTIPERKRFSQLILALNKWLEPSFEEEPQKLDGAAAREGKGPIPLDVPAAPLTMDDLSEAEDSRFDAAGLITNALADVPRSDLPVRTMVSQIDEILQVKLADANMQKWAVRLADFPDKGMVVLVGMEQYEFVDEVPYERVRNIVTESVAEWERRVERGDFLEA
jgi:hypothetical protein